MDTDLSSVEIRAGRNIAHYFAWILMLWNKSESSLRDVASNLVGNGDFQALMRAKLIMVELSTTGLAQGINCIAQDLPNEQSELRELLVGTVKMYETLREYRNYFAHGMYDISKYGLLPTKEDWENEALLHEVMKVGPFAYIIGHSARNESKLILDFFSEAEMKVIADKFGEFADYLTQLSSYVAITFNRRRRKKSSAPTLPALPKKLSKRAYGAKELKRRAAASSH